MPDKLFNNARITVFAKYQMFTTFLINNLKDFQYLVSKLYEKWLVKVEIPTVVQKVS